MSERIAIGVLWHGGELVIEEREEEVKGAIIKRYAFPGGSIEEGEKPREALIREMKEDVGLKPESLKFGRLRVVRLSGLVGYFGETRLPFGVEIKPDKDEKNRIVFQTLDQIYEEVENDEMMPLSAEYVERHL